MDKYTIKVLGGNGIAQESIDVTGDLVSVGVIATQKMWQSPANSGYEIWRGSRCVTAYFPRVRFPVDPFLN